MRSVAFFFFAGDFYEAIRRHVANEPQFYGTHGEVAALALGLANAGLRVTIYSFWNKIQQVREAHGIRIVDAGAQEFDFAKMTEIAEPADALVVHYPDPTLLSWAIRTGKRIFAGLASSDNANTPRRLVRRRRLVELLNHPSIEIVANHCPPATAQFRRFGVNPDKLVAWDIPRSFSPTQYEPKTLRCGFPMTVAYAGNPSPLKGLPDAIEAVRRARKKIDVRLRIAGSEGTSEDGIEYLGMIPNADVMKLFRESDFVVVPSRHEFPEGFPLVMFEAIASRTPIICSDHPMFRDAMSGVASIVPAGKPTKLAVEILRLSKARSEYAQMSRSADLAWSRLREVNDWRQMIEGWIHQGLE